MQRTNGPPSLNLSAAKSRPDGQQPLTASTLSPTSPRSPTSPGSVPASPFLQDSSMGQNMTGKERIITETSPRANANGPTSPTMSAVPQYLESPPGSPKHGREPSKSFFSNLIASKSSHRLQSPDRNGTGSSERATSKSRASSKDRTLYSLRNKGSTPDLPKNVRMPEKSAGPVSEPPDLESLSQKVAEEEPVQPLANRRTKPRFGGILSRTKSIRVDDGFKPQHLTPDPINAQAPATQQPDRDPQYGTALKSAPLRSDHREGALREPTGSTIRNRSADRPVRQGPENLPTLARKDKPAMSSSQPSRDGAGAHLFSNIHQTGRGMGDRLGKAGKGFLGKITKSGSSTERELLTDDTYTCTVINLPLVKQTRRTRIAKRMESSKDKTEFWMPALPWRCIDYLNMNGCEEEGLYRIPGSGKDVKHWQRRFDTEHDINLFDEPELYDINTIGSMFKSWLRELPDEIFPKVVQQKIAERCAGATKTPQLLKDELSMLPPFNYYLLFAITCHLSLLHSYADKNKMDYRNLCICFQPCLKIDGFCFQFLVQDWKNCWQGCWTEKQYLEEEYRYEREGSPVVQDTQAVDDRAISSSDSSQQLQATQASTQQDAPRIQNPTTAREAAFVNGDSNPANTTNGLNKPSETHLRTNSRLPDLRPLSVLKM